MDRRSATAAAASTPPAPARTGDLHHGDDGYASGLDDWAYFLKPDGQLQPCELQTLRQRALGFLFSCAALIAHESDFRIAKEKHLLPQEVEWLGWRVFVQQLDPSNVYQRIDPRFFHGELRLSRLDKIYMLWETPLRPYMAHWNQYGAFLHDDFTCLASVIVFVVVVLTAMQVGLAIDSFKGSNAFSMESYGFAVFAILGPLIAVSLIILVSFGILRQRVN